MEDGTTLSSDLDAGRVPLSEQVAAVQPRYQKREQRRIHTESGAIMSSLPGSILNGRYRIEEQVGEGGMARVFKTWDMRRSVYLALKLLREDLAEDIVFVRRFQREAQALANLQHPHIVRFYGLEEDDDRVFLLMDYIEGTTLRKEIRQAKGPLPLERIVEILRPVCAALGYAHSQGLVHCDVKPANIMIDRSGRVLLADFGIARMSEGATTATMVGAGTPAYMAPEQVKGLDPTSQTDIYALGIVLYEMLTGGERPFTGEMATITGGTGEKVRWEQINLKPPSLRRFNPGISPELEAVVLKCLEKEPARRYASASELFNAFTRFTPGATLMAEAPIFAASASGVGLPHAAGSAGESPTPVQEQPFSGGRPNAAWRPSRSLAVIVLGLLVIFATAGMLWAGLNISASRRDAVALRATGAAQETLTFIQANLARQTEQVFQTEKARQTEDAQAASAMAVRQTEDALAASVTAARQTEDALAASAVAARQAEVALAATTTRQAELAHPATATKPLMNNMDPAQFIYDYYDAINDRNYNLTWSLLSDEYIRRNNGPDNGGYQAYAKFWNSISSVTVKSPRIISWTDSYAEVKAIIHYDLVKGKPQEYEINFALVPNDSGDGWLIDATPYTRLS